MTLEPQNVRFCEARQPHKGHTWYDRGGRKLWCDGRDAPNNGETAGAPVKGAMHPKYWEKQESA